MLLKEEGKLHSYEVPLLEGIFEWLNENMPCPPFKKNLKSGEWTPDAVAWFKDTAQDIINKFWEIMVILNEHDVPARVVNYPAPKEGGASVPIRSPLKTGLIPRQTALTHFSVIPTVRKPTM